ncbi:MAG TPA: DciA family protein [Solimonas sp.]|nr:DciA family protein [Solimonas sp.]
MNPSNLDGKPIGDWLRQQPADVRGLFDRARLIADMNRALPTWSAEPWITQIRVANVRDETLVIHAYSAAALIPLRYRKQQLLAWFNDRFQLQCQKIEAKVRPELAI